jgi:hypothetical protein
MDIWLYTAIICSNRPDPQFAEIDGNPEYVINSQMVNFGEPEMEID